MRFQSCVRLERGLGVTSEMGMAVGNENVMGHAVRLRGEGCVRGEGCAVQVSLIWFDLILFDMIRYETRNES